MKNSYKALALILFASSNIHSFLGFNCNRPSENQLEMASLQDRLENSNNRVESLTQEATRNHQIIARLLQTNSKILSERDLYKNALIVSSIIASGLASYALTKKIYEWYKNKRKNA